MVARPDLKGHPRRVLNRDEEPGWFPIEAQSGRLVLDDPGSYRPGERGVSAP